MHLKVNNGNEIRAFSDSKIFSNYKISSCTIFSPIFSFLRSSRSFLTLPLDLSSYGQVNYKIANLLLLKNAYIRSAESVQGLNFQKMFTLLVTSSYMPNQRHNIQPINAVDIMYNYVFRC